MNIDKTDRILLIKYMNIDMNQLNVTGFFLDYCRLSLTMILQFMFNVKPYTTYNV